MKVDLAITGACAATALGFGAEWGMHAVRCGSSRLELQRLPDRAREWIPGGRVPLQGPGLYENRLAELAAVTARTALDRAGFASPRGLRLAVLLGLPDEVGRPGHSFPGPDRELSGWLGEVLGVVPVEVATMAFGSCSAQGCLARASELLARRGVEACLVGAADSLLQLRIVRWLEEQGRLACSYANDGLRPGEGTAFFVVESSERAATRKAPVLARVLATTARQEEATIESDRPNTARGLTDAARAALVEAGVPARAVGSVFADLNGESYKAREWAVCETRLGIAADVALVHPADAYGDLGVATDAGLVALAAMALASDWLPGPALVFAGADIGIRACSVLVAAPERAAGVAQVTRLQPAIVPAGFELSSLGPDDPDPAEAEDP
ncbi:MAG: hypothetical protein KDE27_11615, partial [Planctomycetes bacterium]|nr:hypothetical protein [Planctomycetota bacterium]